MARRAGAIASSLRPANDRDRECPSSDQDGAEDDAFHLDEAEGSREEDTERRVASLVVRRERWVDAGQHAPEQHRAQTGHAHDDRVLIAVGDRDKIDARRHGEDRTRLERGDAGTGSHSRRLVSHAR